MSQTDSPLRLSPAGHLLLANELDSSPAASAALSKRAVQAFQSSTAAGLFELALASPRSSDPCVAFWSDFAARFLSQICRLAPSGDPLSSIEPPTAAELAECALCAPPMPGAEYLSPHALAQLWQELLLWTEAQLQEQDLSLSDWLKEKAPSWRQLGRVCFHLAENKADLSYPFAFIATYAPRIGKSGNVQFQPLANALKQYAQAADRDKLVQLLKPVHEASKRLPFVEELVETQDLYHPLAWTAAEAYAFLKAIPELESCGLLTRVPNWWKTRTRATASVSLSEKSKSGVGFDAMLRFNVGVALGERNLSDEERAQLLAAGDGLVSLNGQWVEVDQEKLQQALEHWQRVADQAAMGQLSFAQGMRLLAGVSHASAADAEELEAGENTRDWSSIHASDWLSSTLEQMRRPRRGPSEMQPAGLQGTLRPYQQDGFSWLRLVTRLGLGGCLADDMGLGKTIQIIALLLDLKESRPDSQSPRPSLLVLPASLLANWKSEFERFAPGLKLLLLHPSEIEKERLADIAAKGDAALSSVDVVLTTYGMSVRHAGLAERAWELVILDEAQAIKNPGARQTRAVKKFQGRCRIALTGTPIENKLMDLWSLFDFACPGLLGGSTAFQAFAQALAKDTKQGFAPLRKLVSPYILRRLKTDQSIIADLPDKIETKAFCSLSKPQASLYLKAVEELKEALRETEPMARRGLVLAMLMRLKQICNHPSQFLRDHDFAEKASGKFERLRELCEEIAERQEKVLIFTQFREMMDPLTTLLSAVFKRPGLALHGGTPVKQRQGLVEAFQDEKGPPFFVLSLKAGGSGLTLTEASHVIHFDRWWNPAVENQATDRAYRIGQKKNVLVHKFICRGTIEEKVDRLISEKRALGEQLLDNDTEIKLTELSDQELLNLVSLDLKTATSQTTDS